MTSDRPIRIPIPVGYYVGGHGDPIAQFRHDELIILVLHDDGTVTWERENR